MWLDVKDAAGDQVGKHPVAVDPEYRHPGSFNERDELCEIKPALRTLRADRRAARQDDLGGIEATSQDAPEHRSRPVGREQAEQPTRAKGDRDRCQPHRRIVGDFENVMAEQDIGLLRIDRVAQGVEIPLSAADPVTDTCFGGKCMQQRIDGGRLHSKP